MCSILDGHQLSRNQAGTDVRCWILKTRYIPQCEIFFLEELGPACLLWCQRSSKCLKIAKAFVVSLHMHLLWSSK